MWFFVLALSCATCGVAASLAARSRGRSAAAWFFAGLLLGPIGIVITLLMPADAAGVARFNADAAGMKTCPFCAELVLQQAVVCRYCGRDQPAEQEPPVEAETLICLHEAVRSGSWSQAKRAIEQGADVNAKDEQGRTPLQIAQGRKDSAMVDLLAGSGAAP